MELNEKLEAKLAELESKFSNEESDVVSYTRYCNNCDGHCRGGGYAD